MRAIVLNLHQSNPLSKIPSVPGSGPLSTKLITISAAVLICISMVLFTIFSVLTNDKGYVDTHNLQTASAKISPPASGNTKNDKALPGGGIAIGVGGTTGSNSPAVTLTAEPASVAV